MLLVVFLLEYANPHLHDFLYFHMLAIHFHSFLLDFHMFCSTLLLLSTSCIVSSIHDLALLLDSNPYLFLHNMVMEPPVASLSLSSPFFLFVLFLYLPFLNILLLHTHQNYIFLLVGPPHYYTHPYTSPSSASPLLLSC